LAESWEALPVLPAALRQALATQFDVAVLSLREMQDAPDGVRKLLCACRDGELIESVLIPAEERFTLCISSQAGCAFGCVFCASGAAGLARNLSAGEIVGQVVLASRWLRAQQAGRTDAQSTTTPLGRPQNIVVMGMGEPLANYDNLLAALRILNAPWGGAIGARKITISTSGLAPQIRRLAGEPQQFRLAVSLHGATDETRSRVMPINKKYPLKELAAACAFYQEKKGRMITLEYILIAGVNDGLEQVPPLAKLALNLRAKVNLIPYNPVEGLPWVRPEEPAQEAFLAALERHKVPATLRREKGGEIDAACGQLRLKTERELKLPPPM